jgi:surface carbohydrate biosynthesis protein (TIGR04326 family)
MQNNKKKLFIYEDKKEKIDGHKEKNLLFWNGDLKENYSLIKFIELNKNLIRSKYLDFISDLGKKSINNKSLEKISQLTNGHNMWEMSTINEKNIFKSSNIKECLKLIALKLFIKKRNIKQVIFCGNSKDIHLSINELCLKNKISYIKVDSIIRSSNVNEKKKIIPYFLRASMFLIHYIFTKFKIILLPKNYSTFSKNSLLLLSYFVHLKKVKKKDHINLWGDFNRIINLRKKKINIINDFNPSNDVPDTKTFLKKINLMSDKNNSYIALDRYFSLIDVLKVKYNYVYIYLQFLKLRNKKEYFFYNNDKVNFYYFLKDDFNISFYGEVLVKNLIYMIIFENIFSNIPRQKNLFYLHENQGWEKALFKSWNKYKNGNLIGNINSTIRFWDLRYFQSKNFDYKNQNTPNYILVNGKLSKQIASKSNMLENKKKIKEIEALRYQYMKKKTTKQPNHNVIIFGDISIKENYEICEALNNLGTSYKKKFNFYFKPHPTLNNKHINRIKKNFYFLKFLDNNVDYNFFNYSICCGTTSAIIESIYYKIHTTVFIGSNNLNLCPLPKKIFNNFSFDSDELENFLDKKKLQNYDIKNLLNFDINFKKLNNFCDKLKI